MATLLLSCLLFCLYIYHCQSESDKCAADDDMKEIFTYPIDNLSNPIIKNLIDTADDSLSSNQFYFKIEKFLSDYGLSKLQQLINSDDFRSNTIRRELQKSMFGEKTDYINFPNDTEIENQIHPRNILVNVKLWQVTARELPSIMWNIFEYEPLLNFLKQIVVQNGKFNNLYLSNDSAGSAYVFLYENGDHGEWHFDQHPFTCVLMLVKPAIGGRYLYFYNDTQHKHDYTQWNWDIIGQIMRNETSSTQYINFIEANEGDIYCHTGNITFHKTEQSFNNIGEDIDKNKGIVRGIMVLSYADSDGFAHDECRVANDACDNLSL